MGGRYEILKLRDNNYGDHVSDFIIKELFTKDITTIPLGRNYPHEHYMTIGSILKKAQKDSIVWGAGFISRMDKIGCKPDIRCVRGPLTREKLLQQGVECPEKYGDPAVLMREIYIPERSIKYKYGVIPHYVDKGHPLIKDFTERDDSVYINIRSGERPLEMLDKIAECEIIFSSTLHGLIMALTYGKPCIWMKLGNRIVGGRFKFDDFFASIDYDAKDKYLDLSGRLLKISLN